jgi:hypothetical protein
VITEAAPRFGAASGLDRAWNRQVGPGRQHLTQADEPAGS